MPFRTSFLSLLLDTFTEEFVIRGTHSGLNKRSKKITLVGINLVLVTWNRKTAIIQAELPSIQFQN